MSSTLTINTNLAALNAERRLATSTSALRQSFERLASGLRINRPSDDAAGLAVASTLNADARIYSVGIRNVNDALSMYRIAEGSLGELRGVMTRLSELASQSANGVLTNPQRRALDAEAQALGMEYRRIVQSTSFNTSNLFVDRAGPMRVEAGGSVLQFSGGLVGDGSFSAGVSYSAGGGNSAPQLHDLDGDGKLDLAWADAIDGRFSVALGNGDGSFRARTSFSTGAGPMAPGIADLNGDGRKDIVTSDFSVGEFGVFMSNGDGTFRARYSFDPGPAMSSFLLRDFNNDGHNDILGQDAVGGSFSVMFGNGDGTFRARLSSPTGTTAASFAAGDFNRDGNLDIANANSATGLAIYLGNGDGTFRRQASFDPASGVVSVDTDDINGDGILDIAAAYSTGNLTHVFVGNGDGTFQVGQLLTPLGAGLTFVTMADLNGDHSTDVLASTLAGGLSIHLGNGDATFRAAISYPGAGTSASAVADINGDGVLDLAGNATASVKIFLGNGTDERFRVPILGYYSLLNRADALDALTHFNQTGSQLTTSLGMLGATQSRLDTVTKVLQISRENYIAAGSQILDVDVATESASIVRANILQQAGSAILSQANSQPEIALRLLSGL